MRSLDLLAVVGIGVLAASTGAGFAGTRRSGAFGAFVVGLVGGGPALASGGGEENTWDTSPPSHPRADDETVARLSTEQKALVSSAMNAWVSAPPIR